MRSATWNAVEPHFYVKRSWKALVDDIESADGEEMLVRSSLYDGSSTGIVRFSLVGAADAIAALSEHC